MRGIGSGSRQIARWMAMLLAASVLQGCASAPPETREELDESTGTTLLIVSHPLVLARARIDVAAHARDYITLVGTEEDRSGRYTAWLVAHRWSTVDPRMADTPETPPALHIIADDRDIVLTRAEPPPGFLHRHDLLFTPKGSTTRSDAYLLDDATLRYVAGARRLMVRVGEDDPLPAYTLWDDGRAALKEMLERVPRPRR